jgi:hypothetical protein
LLVFQSPSKNKNNVLANYCGAVVGRMGEKDGANVDFNLGIDKKTKPFTSAGQIGLKATKLFIGVIALVTAISTIMNILGGGKSTPSLYLFLEWEMLKRKSASDRGRECS